MREWRSELVVSSGAGPVGVSRFCLIPWELERDDYGRVLCWLALAARD